MLLTVEKWVVTQANHPWFNTHFWKGAPVIFAVTLLLFGRTKLDALRVRDLPLNRIYAAVHVAVLVGIGLLEMLLRSFPAGGSWFLYRAAVCVWVALFPLLVGSLLLACFPLRLLVSLGRALWPALASAAACSLLAVLTREGLKLTWSDSSSRLGQLLQAASFHQASALLRLFYPVVISRPDAYILGTDRFEVEILSACSGVEGLALISAFVLIWLVLARKELRIARALLLFPVALSLMWMLNVVRIVALITIGSAGYPDVAVNGFHSVAGWIAFNLVSLGFLLAAQKIAWFSKGEPVGVLTGTRTGVAWPASRNLAAIYLSPFLAITAAALISQAASGTFEWLYPLRLVVALVVFWCFRREYRAMDWSFGLLGPLVGLAVAGMWIAIHFGIKGWAPAAQDGGELAAGLATLAPGPRVGWIIVRVLAAVVTVPVAEELAFRGFLARRIMCPDVESVSYSRLSFMSIAVSSVAFGVMHGRMVIPGIVAGVAFALVARARGRLGESVAAHVVANLAIAAIVLVRGDYTLW